MLLHITLDDGFGLDVDQNVFTDIRLFEKIRELQKGEPMALLYILDYVLGEDKERLYAHLADASGRTSVDAVTEAVTEIIRKGSPKKSRSSSPAAPGRTT